MRCALELQVIYDSPFLPFFKFSIHLLTHPIRLARFIRFARPSLKMRLASLRLQRGSCAGKEALLVRLPREVRI